MLFWVPKALLAEVLHLSVALKMCLLVFVIKHSPCIELTVWQQRTIFFHRFPYFVLLSPVLKNRLDSIKVINVFEMWVLFENVVLNNQSSLRSASFLSKKRASLRIVGLGRQTHVGVFLLFVSRLIFVHSSLNLILISFIMDFSLLPNFWGAAIRSKMSVYILW